LLRRLDAADAKGRMDALARLADRANGEWLPALRERLAAETDPLLRAHFLGAMHVMGDAAALPALFDLAQRADDATADELLNVAAYDFWSEEVDEALVHFLADFSAARPALKNAADDFARLDGRASPTALRQV